MKLSTIKNKVLALVLILVSTSSQAVETLIISDIDDTLKISHNLETASSVGRSQSSTSVFLGMAEALKLIKNQTQANIYYVSNASAVFMKTSHTNFLKENSFPQGIISFNSVSFGNTKVERIQKIIQKENPRQIIFIGDNGERDIETYHIITQKYPQIKTYQYIRTLYSKLKYSVLPLAPQQISFVSSAEILLHLIDKKILSASATEGLIVRTMNAFIQTPEISGLGPGFLSDWYDCRDHKKTQVHFLMRPEYQDYFNYVNARCSRAPSTL